MQSPATMDHAIEQIHQPVHEIAGSMPGGMIVAHRVLVRSVAEFLNRFTGRGRKRSLLAPRLEALDLLSKLLGSGRLIGFPDPLV